MTVNYFLKWTGGLTPLLPATALFNNKKYVIYLYSSIKIHTFVTSKQRDIWNMVY